MLVHDVAWTVSEELAALADVTPTSLQAHVDEVFQRVHIEALVHGNFTTKEALAQSEMIEAILKPEALLLKELESQRALIIPEGAFSPCCSCRLSHEGR
jgi:insulysin